jgi:rubredoxin
MNSQEGAEPSDLHEIFDELDDALVCRVCGALVPARDEYARVHWDWHEAANGA